MWQCFIPNQNIPLIRYMYGVQCHLGNIVTFLNLISFWESSTEPITLARMKNRIPLRILTLEIFLAEYSVSSLVSVLTSVGFVV